MPLCRGCDYDLRGLPTRGRCPECGLEYDADTGYPDEQWAKLCELLTEEFLANKIDITPDTWLVRDLMDREGRGDQLRAPAPTQP
jgi:hypothetical protein